MECKIKVFFIEGNFLIEVFMVLNDFVYVVYFDISNNNIWIIIILVFDCFKCLCYFWILEMLFFSKVGVDVFGGLNFRDIFMIRNLMLKELFGNFL